MDLGLSHFLAVSAALFTIGVVGIFVNRKNIIVILMAIELILLAVNINLVAFSAFLGDLTGQIFAMFVLTVAAGEAAIGLAILVVYFRNRGSIAVEGDEDMFNQYGVIPVSPEHCPSVNAEAAQTFADWLVSGAGQDAIAAYTVADQQLFFPNAPAQ